MYSVFVNFM